MSDFRPLNDELLASPQIALDDITEAKALGVSLIINNRPDGEAPDQIPGAEIETAAKACGIDYVAIPVTQAGFSQPQVDAMRAAMDGATGKVLAYCRSGTRSTFLWSLAEAKQGTTPDEIAAAAAAAGYDVAPIRPAIEMLSNQSGS
ncbi:MAG: TIGR01244 family sulfur transferase [Pontixanthobacter sp.]